jgi:hypothetical protein
MKSKTTKEYVTFGVCGEWVTETARSWLYTENRPYEKVLDFLLSCMTGTDVDNKTLIKYASDVLIGKKKIIGDTRDNSYCMVDDDTDIIEQYPQYFENKPVAKPIIDDEGNADDSFIRNLKILERRVHKAAQKINSKKDITVGDFGWLRPDGKYFETGWGDHERFAIDYVEKNYTDDHPIYSGDFLVKNGWILLHNPSQGAVSVGFLDISSATKKQKEFLYDYFMERDRPDDANRIWKE